MRCPAYCPHCGSQCIKELTPTGMPRFGDTIATDTGHKGRHETAPPLGKRFGHNWVTKSITQNWKREKLGNRNSRNTFNN